MIHSGGKSVLVATNQLDRIGGSETYTYALIEELKKRNFQVEYFTFKKGRISDLIETVLKVPYKSKSKYDFIIASHQPCVRKLYRNGFIIQVCHGIFPHLEQPSRFADYHIAISLEVEENLIRQGFPCRVINNGINCQRFYPAKEINETLQNVLSLCQSGSANKIIKSICDRRNLNFIAINKFENQVWEIEKAINDADLVIGLGRSAYEAMACGRPVVIYDHRPYSKCYADGYLKKECIEESLKMNCSGRRFKYELSSEELELEIFNYDHIDKNFIRAFSEKRLNIKFMTNEYLDIIYSKKGNNLKRYFKKNIIYFENFSVTKINWIIKKIIKIVSAN